MNYPIPLTPDSMALILGLSTQDLEHCKAEAKLGSHLIAKDIPFELKFFSLFLVDASKCDNHSIVFRSKAPNPHEFEKPGYLRNV